MRAVTGSHDASVTLRRDVEAIKDDLTSLKTDLAAAMNDLIEAGKIEVGEKRAKVEGAVRERIARMNDAAHNVADRGRKVAESAQHLVEERPFQSVAVAFGVGLLLGAVLRR